MQKNYTLTLLVLFLLFMGCGEKKEDDNIISTSSSKKVSNTQEKKIPDKIQPYPMILVEGGTFKMGCDDCVDIFSEPAPSRPVHEVTVSDFYIGKYEVTQFDFFIAQADHNKRLFQEIKELEKTNFDEAKKLTTDYVKYNQNGDLILIEVKKPDSLNLPIVPIPWNLAAGYCNWMSDKEGLERCYSINNNEIECNFSAKGYRLPTEAEWEYAASGGNKNQGYKYSGSANFLKVAWMNENSGNKVHPVGKKAPNELGIYDMTGNVWEWCWDWFDENYYKQSPKENPKGPSTGSMRVARGGGWSSGASYSRIVHRNYGHPYYSTDYTYPLGYGCNYLFGFRIVRTK